MVLDSWLCARLARELDARLVDARIQTVRADRMGLRVSLYRRGERLALRAFLDPNSPMLALREREQSEDDESAGGWAGGVAPLLRGATISAIRAVPNERIIDLDVSSRSSFGVPARHRLVFELEPRKANILLLRPTDDDARWTVLAALRQFAGEGGRRSITVGDPYEPPPALLASLSPDRLADAVKATNPGELRALARLVSRIDPHCTPPLAREVVDRCVGDGAGAHAADTPAADAQPLHRCLLETWLRVLEQVRHAAGDIQAPVYVYRERDDIAACHIVPLSWAVGKPQRAESLNEVCATALAGLEHRRHAPSMTALRERIETLLARCERETTGLQAARSAAEAADSLRRSGDTIYANLASIAPGAAEYRAPGGARVRLDPSLSAKQNAALYFKRYRKARSGLARINDRLTALDANRHFYEQLVWEVDRAHELPQAERDAAVREIRSLVGPTRERSTSVDRKSRSAGRLKPTAPVSLPGGATAYVGRSPKDNERITFTVAGPEDFWFHARGMPGAHVIVKPAEARGSLTADQIETAARLAAGHSRAADARTVEVDYTRRKHVRRQGKGRPGLVWYTNFKTIAVKL